MSARWAVLAVLGAAVGCGALGCGAAKSPCATVRIDTVESQFEETVGAKQRVDVATPLPALSMTSALVELAVPGHGPSVVSVPLGATTRRPVVVAAHGAGDRPDWQCRFWRSIVQDSAFVLCPRGFATHPHVSEEETGYFFTTHHQLGAEVTAALRALEKRFASHADVASPVYAGFSQGAIMGALLLPHHPARFGRAVLIEGGAGQFQEWNLRAARLFHERGGRRVLLACGRAPCANAAEVSAGYMRREGVEASVLHAAGAGHTYGGAVGEEVARAFAWVIEDDPRFATVTRGPQ